MGLSTDIVKFCWVTISFLTIVFSSSCVGAPVYVTNGSHILKFDRDTKQVDSIYSEISGRIVGLAVDINKGLLFWSNIAKTHRTIYMSNLNGSEPVVVVKDVHECNGLSVDWISHHLYWTDAGKRTVEIANYDGTGRRILIGDGLQYPRGIVVDPVLGYFFWADQGTKVVERAWLDGSHREAIVQHGVFWPNQLAISLVFRKLYWVDGKENAIMSCHIDGDNVELERDLTEITDGNPSFGLAVVGNTAIISTWFSATLYSMLVETKLAIWRSEVTSLGSEELFSLLVIDSSLQPLSDHPCGFPDRGGCSHLCLPSRGIAYRCVCPSYGGLALSPKGKECQVPKELLFFTFKNSGEVGFVSLDGAPTSDVTLVARSRHPSAVTYDPVDKVVYWSDVMDHTIYRTGIDGSGSEVFLNESHGIGIVDGMSLDWIDRRLYITNMGQSSPFLDGAVYTWHRIEVIDLDRKWSRTIITDVELPRGIALDLENGYLYYGDWGEKPKVVQTLLDGTQPTVLLSSQISNPNAMAVRGDNLYIADSNFNNRTEMAQVLVYHVANHTWERLLLEENILLPMGLTIWKDTMYYTDWVSMTAESGKVMSVDLGTEENGGEILIGQQPTGLHYSPLFRIADPMESSCASLICSHECVRTRNSEYQPYRCMCPDQSSLILSSNKVTCARPENFLLFADLNTVKMLSLDPETEEAVHTVYYGDMNANIVALVYDDGTDTIYWSDQTRKAVFSSPLKNISPSIVFEGDCFIDGLVIDTERQRLFWTAMEGRNGTGHIAKINLQRGLISYSQVVTGLSNPRAVTLCPEKKFIFWTEHQWSKTSASIHRAKVNGHHHLIMISENLYWPNSLVVFGEQLYVADGVGKVISVDLDGSNMKELLFLSGSVDHIFGMALYTNVLIYTDWYTNTIKMVNLVTGDQETMATNLSRPTAVVLYHPTNLTEESLCETEQNNCSHDCIPLPRRLHCSCPVGYKLGSDRSLCKKLDTPWEVTEGYQCPWSCHEHAHCGRLVPLLKFQCVCNAGFQGDGRYCLVCPIDTYKSYLGNDSCIACADDMSTQENVGATQCICSSRTSIFKDGYCKEIATHMPTMAVTATDSHPVDKPTFSITTATVVTNNSVNEDTTQLRTSGTLVPESMPTMFPATSKLDVSETLVPERSPTNSPAITNFSDLITSVPETSPTSTKDSTTNSIPNHTITYSSGGNNEVVVVDQMEQPYFENCPEGETVIISLPPFKDKVELPITWAARDQFNNKLPIKSNYPIKDEKITFQWLALGQDSRQKVMVEAEDQWKQKIICHFNVIVEDKELPNFTYCPHDLVIKTNQVRERVLWPRPEATDNIGLRSLTGSQKPGSDFLRGTTLVNYTAVDKAGNTALCNFSVTIVKEQQCSLPAIKNGAFVCGHDSDDLEMCYIVCENSFVINPVSSFTKAFSCMIPEDMVRLTNYMKTQEPCLFKRIPSTARQEFSLSLRGPCDINDNKLISELSARILNYLGKRNICPTARCEFSNITIHCGSLATLKLVRKRSLKKRFDVKWNITVENSTGFSKRQIEAILMNIRLELMKFVSHLYINVDSEHYSTVPGSITVTRVKWMCHEGEMVYENGCVECPAGTMHNMTSSKCDLCKRGTYQPLGSQLTCQPCVEGYTAQEGAIESSECVSLPSIDEMSKFLIITACTFGFVFLCMAIFMYLQYQRQQRHMQQSLALARANRYITPNIYVAPPPLPKPKIVSDVKPDNRPCHLYNNHDYEDIDNTTLSTRTLYQNDFQNFSPSLRSNRSPKPNRYYMYDQ